jgi:hypothetical protein
MDRAAAERGQERIVENIRRGRPLLEFESFGGLIDRPVQAGRINRIKLNDRRRPRFCHLTFTMFRTGKPAGGRIAGDSGKQSTPVNTLATGFG